MTQPAPAVVESAAPALTAIDGGKSTAANAPGTIAERPLKEKTVDELLALRRGAQAVLRDYAAEVIAAQAMLNMVEGEVKQRIGVPTDGAKLKALPHRFARIVVEKSGSPKLDKNPGMAKSLLDLRGKIRDAEIDGCITVRTVLLDDDDDAREALENAGIHFDVEVATMDVAALKKLRSAYYDEKAPTDVGIEIKRIVDATLQYGPQPYKVIIEDPAAKAEGLE